MKTPLPFAVLIVLGLVPLSTFAQFEPYPEEEPEDAFEEVWVTLYEDPHFEGESITLPANTALEDLDDVRFGDGRRVDNRISSIWIEGHAHVTLYDYDDFGGDSITLMESEADLELVRQGPYGDWDNDISSISVTTHSEEMVCEPGPVDESPYPVVVAPPRHPGPSIPAPTVVVTCPSGCSHRHCGRSGHGHYGHGYGHGHPYRMDPAIIRKVERAYRDVLRRSPDKEGRRTYYYVMLERGWSESRLRKELRKSDEYHQQTIPTVVRKVYREVLGREPDPSGFKFYTEKMSRDGWYESHLRKALKRSPEYANRGRTSSTPPSYRPRPEPKPVKPLQSVATPRPRPIPVTPLAKPARSTTVRTPTPAATPPKVRPRPVATPKPPRVTPTPAPRPSPPKVVTRQPKITPPKPMPKPVDRTRPAPPNLK